MMMCPSIPKQPQLLESIIQTVPTIMYIFDLTEQRNVLISDYGLRILGYEPDAISPDFVFSRLHPEDRDKVIEHFRQLKALPPDQIHEYEYRIQHQDGTWRWFRSQDRAFMRDEQGEVFQILGVAHDITEQKQAMTRDAVYHQQAERNNIFLQQFAAELAAALSTAEVVETIIRRSLEAVQGGFSAVFRLSEDKQFIERLETVDIDKTIRNQYPRFPLDWSTPIARAIQNAEIFWIETQADYIRFYPHLEADIIQANVHATLCIPFFDSGGIAGGIHITFFEPRRGTLAERNLLFALAQICGQALERARQYDAVQSARCQLEQTADRLARLLAVTSALGQTATMSDVALVTVEQTTGALNASSGTFLFFNENDAAFQTIYTTSTVLKEKFPAWKSELADPRYPISDIVRTKQALWFFSNEECAARYPLVRDVVHPDGGALALLPLLIGDRVLAVLALTFNRPRHFSEDERAFVLALTQPCAQALDRVLLMEQAQQNATLHERQRLARDLHDAVSQTL